MDDTKTCTRCGVEKSVKDFNRNYGEAGGRMTACKPCFNAASRAWYATRPRRPSREGVKVCRDCGVEKPFSEFYAHPGKADGRMKECKDCKRAYEQKRYVLIKSEALYQGRIAARAEYGQTHRFTCLICNREKPATSEHFHRAGQSGPFDPFCRECVGIVLSQMNREQRPSQWNYQRTHYVRLKLETLIRYSGGVAPFCACCGEREIMFLSLDHIDGGGGAQRKALDRRSGGQFYRWLRQRGYPEGFQTLCHNCNMAKGFYGACPHTREGHAPS